MRTPWPANCKEKNRTYIDFKNIFCHFFCSSLFRPRVFEGTAFARLIRSYVFRRGIRPFSILLFTPSVELSPLVVRFGRNSHVTGSRRLGWRSGTGARRQSPDGENSSTFNWIFYTLFAHRYRLPATNCRFKIRNSRPFFTQSRNTRIALTVFDDNVNSDNFLNSI